MKGLEREPGIDPGCAAIRRQLFSRAVAVVPEVGSAMECHLESCASCAELARRRARVAAMLGEGLCAAQPDAGFAARVAARLEGRSVELLGWASLKILPPAIIATLLLAWLAASQPSPSPPTQNLARWAYASSQSAWSETTAGAPEQRP